MTPTLEIAGLVGALAARGETPAEVAGFVDVMRSEVTRVPLSPEEQAILVDTCGTGGDASRTFNISTAAALVAAAAGASIAKHGNRSFTTQCGSADVLEALGVKIDVPVAVMERALREAGIVFMFAPLMHPAMRFVGPVRRELGVRTIFNILGPLTNPASAPNQLMGVFHPDLVGIQVRVMERLGAKHVLVVYGKDGMDEVSLGAATLVGELKDGKVTEYEIHPEDFGLQMVSNRSLKVENAEESKTMLLGALSNTPGVAREIVALNAGTALYSANVTASIADGIQLARETIANGRARAKVDELVRFTQQFKR